MCSHSSRAHYKASLKVWENMQTYTSNMAAMFRVLLICPLFSQNHLIHLLLHSFITLWFKVMHFSRVKGCCRKEVQVPYNQIIYTNMKIAWRLMAMDLHLPLTLTSLRFSCLMPVVPITFSILYEITKDITQLC